MDGGVEVERPLWPPSNLYASLDDVERLQATVRDNPTLAEVLRFSRASPELRARLSEGPVVLWRYLATPNQELLRFLRLAEAAGRRALVLEMPHDRFRPTVNGSKRCLGKLAVARGSGRPDTGLRSVRIIDFDVNEGQRFADVRCLDGSLLKHFHHDLCRRIVGPDLPFSIMDAPVFEAEPPRSYYERFFALFTCFGALADSFVMEGTERAFVERVVIPAFESTVRRFGAKPMIVRLLPEGTEGDPRWDSYPPEALPLALKAARRCAPA